MLMHHLFFLKPDLATVNASSQYYQSSLVGLCIMFKKGLPCYLP